jgi:hypothetical protein
LFRRSPAAEAHWHRPLAPGEPPFPLPSPGSPSLDAARGRAYAQYADAAEWVDAPLREQRIRDGLTDVVERGGHRRASVQPAEAPQDDGLAELERQVLSRHFGSDEERRRTIMAGVEASLRARGKVDLDERDLWFQHIETRWQEHEQQLGVEAVAAIEAREIAEIEREMARQQAIRQHGVDPRKYPVLTMLGALEGPLDAVVRALPLVGEAVSIAEAICGENIFTGAPIDRWDAVLDAIIAGAMDAGLILAAGELMAKAIATIADRTAKPAADAYRAVQALSRVPASDVRGTRAALRAAEGGKAGAAEREAGRRLLRTLEHDHLTQARGGVNQVDPYGPGRLETESETTSGTVRSAERRHEVPNASHNAVERLRLQKDLAVREQIAEIQTGEYRVFAKGTDIDDVERLVAQWGGSPADWEKIGSRRTFRASDNSQLETHAYKNTKTGDVVEVKVKDTSTEQWRQKRSQSSRDKK